MVRGSIEGAQTRTRYGYIRDAGDHCGRLVSEQIYVQERDIRDLPMQRKEEGTIFDAVEIEAIEPIREAV
jgi:hypothetical protein